MSKNQGNGGQGNNQSAPKSGPIIQPGEDAAAMSALSQDLSIPRLGAGASPAQQASMESDTTANVATSASLAQELGADDQQPAAVNVAVTGTLADLQRQYDAASKQARNNPAMITKIMGDASQSLAPTQTVDIPHPSRGRLEDMKRPDLLVEPADPFNMKHAEMMAFLEEMVIINIHESSDPTDDDPVPVGNNGRMVYIKRGKNFIVKRKYVSQLLRAKPQHVKTNVVRSGDDVQNRVIKRSAMRYPFSVVRDDNPLGQAWLKKILQEV